MKEPRDRKLWAACGVVLLLALALRLLHLASLREAWEGTRLFSLARGDAAYHWREALSILDQSFLLRDVTPWKAPGYSYFLAGLMSLVGPEPASLRWIMACLGALNCAGLVLLARRALTLPGAFLAGLVAALNGTLILFDGELFFPTVLVSLNLGAFLLLTKRDPGPGAHVGAGVLFALAALVHPTYVLPALVIFVWLLRRGRGRALGFGLAVALTILPVTLQNRFVRNEPVLLSASGGINLYVGNQPCFDQRSGQQLSTVTWGRLLSTPTESGYPSAAERDRFYLELAVRRALEAPLTTIGLWAEKAVLLLNPVELGNNIRLYELRDASAVLRAAMGHWGPIWLPFGLWAPLALLGVGGILLRRGREAVAPLHVLLMLWTAAVAVTVVLSFNTARYRAPIVFFGCIWVAWALLRSWSLWKGRRRRTLAVGAASVLCFTVISGLLAAEQTALPPPAAWSQAQIDEAEGRPHRAEQRLLGAMHRTPGDPLLMMEVAAFYGRQNQPERERQWYQRVLEQPALDPDLRSAALERIARSLLDQRLPALARPYALEALTVDADRATHSGVPHYDLGLAPITACRLRLLLARIELSLGDRDAARRLVDRARGDCPRSMELRPRIEALSRALANP